MDFQTRSIAELYGDHLSTMKQRYEMALSHGGHEGVLIHSGNLRMAFLDDQPYPFRANPHFSTWLPLQDNDSCFILLRPGETPRLFYFQSEDYWNQSAGDPTGFWTGHFEIDVIGSLDPLRQNLGSLSGLAYIGEETEIPEQLGIEAINSSALLDPLHYERARKTDYEKRCILEANLIAATGHLAARDAFQAGRSEYEIQNEYLRATQQREKDSPYPSIVGINEHSAILHYQHYEHTRHPEQERRSMLIDAGATYNGYASDITRSHAARDGLFKDLVDAMDTEQQAIINDIEPGSAYLDLHLKMHQRIANLLREFEITSASLDELMSENLTFTFMPHGLGHFLGLQTHDVGGHQQNREGDETLPPDTHPALRITRPMEDDQVFTIEPGIYFIPPLLRQLRDSGHANSFNWARIDELVPFGGIRIEDNICIHGGEIVNLTRQSFDSQST